ncbi:hypothetical protein MKX01_014745 [Papaver californicum]|nr:hypothetical protein MKX01_014745 [Papaver californicum]
MPIEMQKKTNFSKGGREHDHETFNHQDYSKNFDDDGREKRTGTLLTASAHIITAVIGSGILSLAWAIAQLGWIAGPVCLIGFSLITWFTSILLAECYRSPDPITGQRNYTYMDAVRANLGGVKIQLCGIAQYANLVGVTIGYTITASMSMAAVQRSNCFHKFGHGDQCYVSTYYYTIIFAVIQILLCQIPNFNNLSWLSIVAAVMSFAYSSIGIGVTVGVDVSGAEKVWRTFQALGNIAFAYAFSNVLVEIQDTLKSSPPEKIVMKKVATVGVATTTLFYVLCGIAGYAAFGNDAPGNFLSGFGFYEPFWLIDFANLCSTVHLVGAYQVFVQPLFAFVEKWCSNKWPEHGYITTDRMINLPCYGEYPFNWLRLVWRTLYVIMTALLAMIFPFFNEFVGFIGSLSFYPLTVYFPIEMYIARAKIPKYSTTWIWLKVLSWGCLVVPLVAMAGSVQGLALSVKSYKPFKIQH